MPFGRYIYGIERHSVLDGISWPLAKGRFGGQTSSQNMQVQAKPSVLCCHLGNTNKKAIPLWPNYAGLCRCCCWWWRWWVYIVAGDCIVDWQSLYISSVRRSIQCAYCTTVSRSVGLFWSLRCFGMLVSKCDWWERPVSRRS